MPDEASTPPADTQAPPSEPAPATESAPAEAPHAPETTQPEIAPPPEASPTDAEAVAGRQTESAPEAPSGAVEAPRGSENLEAVIDTTPQNTSTVSEPPASVQNSGEARQTAQTVPAQSTTPVIRPHADIAKARAKIQETKRKKLDKIMAKLAEKGKITNDEVEKLLRVSDATATRYLQALEKENKIKQTGRTGMGVFYKKI